MEAVGPDMDRPTSEEAVGEDGVISAVPTTSSAVDTTIIIEVETGKLEVFLFGLCFCMNACACDCDVREREN